MIFCLPLLFADGRFTSLDRITVRQLEKFIPFMVSCSVGREKPLGSVEPLWWPSDLPFSIPLKKPHSVSNKWLALLKSLVCRCYTYHGCEFMLRFCTDLTNTPNSVLTYVDTWNDTVSVYSKKTGKLVVTFRSENMTYDKTPQTAKRQIFGNNKTANDTLCDNTHFLDIYVCEMCDFTFPNLEAAQEHEEICRADSASVTLHNIDEPLASEQERFLDYLGLRSNAEVDSTVQCKSTCNDVRWKHAGVNFTRCCSIPVSSPLGLALHRRTKPSTVSSEVHLGKVERHCVDNTELLPRTREARHFDGTWPTTWKRNKTSTNVWAHIYKFPRKHLRCRPPVPDTGLTAKSLKLLQLCKPLSVVLHKLEREDIHVWSKKNDLENLNRDMEIQIDTSSENFIDDNYLTSIGENSITESYLMSLNSHYLPDREYGHDVRKQLLCQPKSAEMELHSGCTENIVQAGRAYSCETEHSEGFSVLSNAVSVPETKFPQKSEAHMRISTSPSEGSVCSSPEPFFPQSVTTMLSSETDVSVVDATDFSLSQEIVSSDELTQCDISPLYIPEAHTVEFNPLHLRASRYDTDVQSSQIDCEYTQSPLISYILPQKLIPKVLPSKLGHQVYLSKLKCRTSARKKIPQSAALTISDTCTPQSQVHSSILSPLLPLTATPPVICTAVTQKSFMESESIDCNYPAIPADVYSSLSENVLPKHQRNGALYADHISKPSGEQLTVQKQVQQKNILLTASHLNDTHGICGTKDTSASCTSEEINTESNIKQDASCADNQYTPLRIKTNVSLNTEFENLPCTSTVTERDAAAAASNPVFSVEGGFRSKLMCSNDTYLLSLHDPVYSSLTYANTSRTNSGYIVRENKTYHNCLETSDAQCQQRLLFKSAPSSTSVCARKSVETSLKTIKNKFPRRHKTAAIKINKNVEKLSREVQRLMKDECVSIRDKQFFKIVNCDYKVLRKRELRARCSNRINRVKNDIVKPFKTKSFKAYKYFSTCKVSSGVRNSFHFDVVGSLQELNSRECTEVPVTQRGRCPTFYNQACDERGEQVFNENSTSINVNHKIQNSLSMRYELHRKSVELKLDSANSVQQTHIEHCGKLEAFHQYSLTSVINEAAHNSVDYLNNSHKDVNGGPSRESEKVSPFVSCSDTCSGDMPKMHEVVDVIGRAKHGSYYTKCQMKLRSQCQGKESVSFTCTSARSHRVTRKTVAGSPKSLVCIEKQKIQRNKIMKHLNRQMSLKTQFTDVYHIMLQGSSRTQPSENEEHLGYTHFSSSSKIRIFTKRQVVNQQQKKSVSRELQQLLQDECKELVNLGLERSTVPVKTSSKALTFENILIAQLREIEEDHREWFKDQDVMCVINFPYEFRSV